MSAPASAPQATRRRGFQPLRDLPVMGWLAVLVIVTLVHPWVPAPRWLMLHLLLLGAVSHAIHVWSQYFAETLLHSAPDEAAQRNRIRRLGLHNLGALIVIAGVLLDQVLVVTVGAAAVAAAALWHVAALVGQLRRALGSRFSHVIRYYVAAAALLPIGAVLGVLLVTDLRGGWHERVLYAHVTVNLLGWVGLTVLGTLLTLWPTMLRTRISDRAGRAGHRALPVLLTGVLVAAGGALAGSTYAVAAGVASYLGGVGLLAVPFVDAARRKRPTGFSTWSVLAGVLWLVGLLVALVVALVVTGDWTGAADALAFGAPFVAAGFAAQVLLGALSYLVPVALGGGPTPVRAASAVLDRGSALRVTVTNAGLLLLLPPAPGLVRVAASLAVLMALASFLPLLVLAIRTGVRTKLAVIRGEEPPAAPAPRPRGQLQGLAVTGLAVVALGVAGGVALDPAALGVSTAAAQGSAAATGETTTVRVEARDMRFFPDTVEAPAGDRLVVELVNTDAEDVHDLVLDSGARSGRLSPGESTSVDVGVVGRDLEGWCSVLGHRQMGMVLTVVVTGASATEPGSSAVEPAEPGDTHDHAHGPAADHGEQGGPAELGQPGSAGAFDPMAEPDGAFTARDATLPPLGDRTVHKVTLEVQESLREVAPGLTQRLWTFGGTAPGPVLHGRVGDVFEVTLVNDGTIGHSIDFHAGAQAPDRPMRTIAPGESLVYRFTAERAGIWMYHCSTMPMSAHIANGMFGAVVIEPPDLPAVDRSYVLVQSEHYFGPDGEVVDLDKLAGERPDAVSFNGYPNQYAFDPLPAEVDERVRLWVLDAGPNRASSFHVIGGQFDTVWTEGDYTLRPGRSGGAQVLPLLPAQGGFVELEFPEKGTYPFVSHIMVDAERGARGLFTVR